ncbi:histidine kinase [Streptomyces sp. NPDC005963]|uniref:sensor histidine kinase n=1 Tax=Streptomyces sp. NPDC005963 TaxID=3156721 RepID=UPI0033F58DE0
MSAAPPTAKERDAGGDQFAPVCSAARKLWRLASGLPPAIWDGLLAALLFMAVLGPSRQEGPQGLLIQAALLLPLVWRRRAPFMVFCVITAVAFAQWLIGVQLPADVALLVALYTVAAHADWRRLLPAGVVMAVAVLMAAARWAPPGRVLASVAAMSAMAVAAAVLGNNMRTKRAYVASLKERAVNLQHANAQEARLAAAEERARIAREMHDIVTHNLSVIVALADAAVYTRRGGSDETVMSRISETGRQALTDMRRSLGVLQADEPDAQRHPVPGIAQLEALAQHMRAAALPTRLTLEGDPTAVSTAAQLTVYRLVQEALTNTLKHSPRGTQAQVRVVCAAQTVTVDVTDDGITTQPLVSPSGHGIAGMRARATAYGGSLTAGPLPTGGWRVFARLNLDPTEDGAA